MVLRLVVLVGATKLLLQAAALLRLGVPVVSLRSSVNDERSLLVDKRLGDRDDVLDEALDHVGRERLSNLFGDGASDICGGVQGSKRKTHDDSKDVDLAESRGEGVVGHDPSVQSKQLLDPLLLDVGVLRLELVGKSERDDGKSPAHQKERAKGSALKAHLERKQGAKPHCL
jgi:hypothetical protein